LLERTFLVLNLIAESTTAISFTEILTRSNLNRSTLSKILGKLTAHGMLEKVDGGYRMGWKASYYAEKGSGEEGYIRHYRSVLEHVSQEFLVSAILIRSDGRQSVCLDKVMNEHAPSMRPVGASDAENPISPWSHIMARAKEGFDAQTYALVIIKAARETPYVKQIPEVGSLVECLTRWPEDIGDDGGLIIPHVRRLAIRLPMQPAPAIEGFIVVSYSNGADVNPRDLVHALQSYTRPASSSRYSKGKQCATTGYEESQILIST
jgi:hypothetical protein